MKKFILILFIACAPNPNRVEVVGKETYLDLMEKQFQIIDVRTPTEYQEGHIDNALNVDFKSADFIKNISIEFI